MQFTVTISDPSRYDVVLKNMMAGGMGEAAAAESAQRYAIDIAARRLEAMLSSGTKRFGRPSGEALERLMVLASVADGGERAVVRVMHAASWDELLAG